MISRRTLLASLAATAAKGAAPGLVSGIEPSVLWPNFDGNGRTWFHPRICRIGGAKPRLLMTLQEITGSDVFHAVQWCESLDGGRTWTAPQPVPGLGRRNISGGLSEGYCDTVPEYHARTGTVIAMAHNVYYEASGKLTRPSEQRWPVYVVRDVSGRWGPVRKLEWTHPEATAMYTSNCSQRVTLPDGNVLVPVSHGPTGRADRGVTTLRCSFDGAELRVLRWGNTLRCSVGRGLLEPSLAALDGVYYMTIRAENGQGFVTRSDDGLNWTPMVPWRWDDGEPVPMSSTQQRWLPHSNALFLVYTRQDTSNRNVMRWRAPLWMAEVDRRTLALKRSTERIVLPMNADGVVHPEDVEHQGNFHTTAISPAESLVSTGTVVPKNWTGAIRIARIQWSAPNRLVTES